MMLQAGFARLDMTPPLGTPLAGYYSQRLAQGVLDPLSINALALSDGEHTAVMLTVDVLGIRRSYTDEIRAMIAQRTGLPVAHIMVAGLHQHTSMRIADAWERSAVTDREYLDVLYRKLCDAAQMAIADLSDATVTYAERETPEQIAFIRRYRMKDGSVRTNPGVKYRDDTVGTVGEADNTVRLVKFLRGEGKKDIALVNFSTHPDTIGGKMISADWPGFVRRFTEQAQPDTHCICLNGAQGDSNHVDPWREEAQSGYFRAEHMGRVIADTAQTVWDNGEAIADAPLFSNVKYVYNRTNTNGIEYYDECAALYYGQWNGEKVASRTPHGYDLGECERIVKLRERGMIFQCVPVNVLGFGRLAIVGFGGEPFMHYAQLARESAPDKHVVCACCANGYEDYLPTDSAFDEGGYEATSTPFTKGLEADCVAAVAGVEHGILPRRALFHVIGVEPLHIVS
jgi:hypothetical protein